MTDSLTAPGRLAHSRCMPERLRKPERPRDVNALAASIVQDATGTAPVRPAEASKNQAAVALGRLGGLKGGRARATKLNDAERSAQARRAAQARWAARTSGDGRETG